MPKDTDEDRPYPMTPDDTVYEFPNLTGLTLVTLGNPYTKLTVSMVTAHRRLPNMTILGAETYEEAAAMVMDPDQPGDLLLMCCLYPKSSAIWADMKMTKLFEDLAPPFVYGQFGEGDPYYIAVHPAAERFAAGCPTPTVFEYVNSNERAPETAKRLHQELGRTSGFITAEFVGSHVAPDQVVKYVSKTDMLPFALLVPR